MKKFTTRFSAVLFTLILLTQPAHATQSLVPVGQVIAIELGCAHVRVADFDETVDIAKSAGLQVGDRITKVDDYTVTSIEDVRNALKCSDGTVQLQILRDGKQKDIRLEPAITSDGPRLGVYLQQGITGVGTVTYYDPDSKTIAALGHGVSTAEGELISMTDGAVYRATVESVRKGKIGNPGQLMGKLSDKTPLGILSKNTPQGIFGKAMASFSGNALPIAQAGTIKTGPATILSTIAGSTVQEYSVEILKVYPNSGATGRNMLLKVTDPVLLDATGGIVQGMSGSPIIQDGKLVGAVTHVLVNDPTTGYGIFIENMLDAAA